MLENFNDYISFGILLLIVLSFLFIFFRYIFRTVERSRIKKDMERRSKERKGEL